MEIAVLVFLHLSAALATLVAQAHPHHGVKYCTVWFMQINSCHITSGGWKERLSHVDVVLLAPRAREQDLTCFI